MKKIILPILLCGLWACKDEVVNPIPPAPPAASHSIQITVWDAASWDVDHPRGTVATGATVQLYASRADYLIKKAAYTVLTNAQGEAKFDSLEAGTYFIVALKGEKTNTWDDGTGSTMVADSIFQTVAEINDPATPIQPRAIPGDLRFHDLNFDGMINASDVGYAPFFSLTTKKDTLVKTNVLIALKANLKTGYASLQSVERALADEVRKISDVHQRIVMLDGVYSDEADCTGLPAEWCDIDQHQITASNQIVSNIWRDSYASIMQLNRMLETIRQIPGDTVALSAQIRGFRGFLYAELSMYFGDLPIVTSTSIPTAIQRSAGVQTQRFIQDDLKAALVNLPQVSPEGKKWQINAAAVNIILGRVSVYGYDTDPGVVIRANRSLAALSGGFYTPVAPAQAFASSVSTEIIWDMTFSMPSPFKEYFKKSATFCPVVRVSEAKLMRALGLLQTTDPEIALVAINEIKAKYNETPLPEGTSPFDMIMEIRRLYRQELSTEGFAAADHLPAQMPIPLYFLNDYYNITQNVNY